MTTSKKISSAVAALAVVVTAVVIWIVVSQKGNGTSIDSAKTIMMADPPHSSKAVRHAPEQVCTMLVQAHAADDGTRDSDVKICVHRELNWRREACSDTNEKGEASLSWPCSSVVLRYLVSVQSPQYSQLAPAVVAMRAGDLEKVTLDLVNAKEYLLGHVLDSTGGPVGGAMVRALCKDLQETWEGENRGFSFSAEDGTFRIPLGRRCSWDKVVATAPGYAEGYAEIVSTAEISRIVLAPAATISGTVLYEGKGVNGAIVSVYRDAPAGVVSQYANLQALSDVEGKFEIHDVPPGRWVLSGLKEDLRGSSEATLLVGVGDVIQGTEVVLQNFSRVRVTVLGQDGTSDPACEDAVAELHSKTNNRTFRYDVGIIKEGTVEYRGVAAGQYVATARCRGHSPLESAPFAVSMDDSLVSVPLQTKAGIQLSGRVIYADGAAVEGALVGAIGEHGRTFERTDKHGRFVFYGLLESDGMLEVVQKTGERITRSVNFGKDDDVDIQLDDDVVFAGTVVSTNGIGVANATVHIVTDGDSVAQCPTTMSGNFQCSAKADLVAGASPFLEARRGADVLGGAVGSTDDIVVISTSLSDITGQVFGPEGEESSFAAIQLQELDGDKRRVVGAATADVSGEFQVAGALVGRDYVVVATSRDGRRAESAARPGETIDIVLPQALELEIVISGCGARRGGHIAVRPAGGMFNVGERQFTLATDPATVTLDGLQAGTYNIAVDVGDCGSKEQEVFLHEDSREVRIGF